MKRMSLKLVHAVTLGVTVLGLGTLASAHTNESYPTNFVEGRSVCEGFAPENSLKIPVGFTMSNRFNIQGGITEAQFNKVMDRIQLQYDAEVKALGNTLTINRKWSDPTVNASAQQFGTSWVINMYGGLARHSAITEDGMALVACHEMGHHLGGAPKISGWYGNDWATNEGGADYYGTLKCARRYFANDNNGEIIKTLKIDPIAEAKCRDQHSNSDMQVLCMRETAAAQSVTALLAELGGDPSAPKFDTPATNVVDQTNDAHPKAQCRLDTYYAGAGCKADVSTALSNTDYHEGSCTTPNDSFGFRPTCWFKPD